MKWILLFLSCLSFAAFGSEVTPNGQQSKSDSNLSHFDLPLLLGDWYLMNPDPEQGTENFRAIKLTLDSNYSFTIDIQKKTIVSTIGKVYIMPMKTQLFWV